MPKNNIKSKGGPPTKKTKSDDKLLSEVPKAYCPLDFLSPEKLISSLIVNSNLSHHEFMEKHFEKEILIMKNPSKGEDKQTKNSTDLRSYFAKLFSLEVLEHIATNFSLKAQVDACASKVVHGKKLMKDVNENISVKHLNKILKDGYTIQVHHPQRWHNELWKLQEAMECYFGSLVGSNVYITPENSQGLAAHHDDVEVFVLQLHGSKQWSLYEPVNELPVECSGDLDEEKDNLVKIKDALLEPGDILFMPRGVVHQAKVPAGSGTSIHLTISTYQSNSWASYLSDVVPDFLDQMTTTVASLRQGLPRNRFESGDSRQDFKNKLVQRIEDTMKIMTKQLSSDVMQLPVDDIAVDFFKSRLPPFRTLQGSSKGEAPTADGSVRFVEPAHVYLQETKHVEDEDDNEDSEGDSEDEEEEEEKMQEEELVVNLHHSINNQRETHMVGAPDPSEFEPITIAHHLKADLEMIHERGDAFTEISALPSDADDLLPVLEELWKQGVIATKS